MKLQITMIGLALATHTGCMGISYEHHEAEYDGEQAPYPYFLDLPIPDPDPVTGLSITYDGDPLYALDGAETREIYDWVQGHMGLTTDQPPHIVYTDKVIMCGGKERDGCMWHVDPNVIAVQAKALLPSEVRTIMCHEFVHHLYDQAGYGGDSPYNDEHASPYYYDCELRYLYQQGED